jgi:hypothetical protein
VGFLSIICTKFRAEVPAVGRPPKFMSRNTMSTRYPRWGCQPRSRQEHRGNPLPDFSYRTSRKAQEPANDPRGGVVGPFNKMGHAKGHTLSGKPRYCPATRRWRLRLLLRTPGSSNPVISCCHACCHPGRHPRNVASTQSPDLVRVSTRRPHRPLRRRRGSQRARRILQCSRQTSAQEGVRFPMSAS